MKTNMLAMTAVALVAANGAIGCAAQEDSAQSSSAAETTSPSPNLASDIDSLRALNVVDVSEIASYFTEGKNCYGSQIFTSLGMVCPDEVDSLADKIAAQDRRLDAFVAAAQAAAAGPATLGTPAQAQRDIAALQSLHIVAVGALLLDAPETGGCYNTFCERSDAYRAGKLRAIAEATKGL